MADTLPPLPEPAHAGLVIHPKGYVILGRAPMFTEAQMYAFRAEGVQAEREACAKVCEHIHSDLPGLQDPDMPRGWCYSDDGHGCATAIRAQKDSYD